MEMEGDENSVDTCFGGWHMGWIDLRGREERRIATACSQDLVGHD